jgi:SAM-dependent methyltransferase
MKEVKIRKNTKSDNCGICGGNFIKKKLELGKQPVSSHFGYNLHTSYVRHPLSLVQCAACGTIQLGEAFPYADLVPPYDWITYREPEEHLDDLVSHLAFHLEKKASILGLSFKDQTTLDRLRNLGFENTRLLNPKTDLGIDIENANIETVAACFAENYDADKTHDLYDVIICRHIIEHSPKVKNFLIKLNNALKPDGLLVVEVPDCEENLKRGDIIMVWEEHVSYFTSKSFRRAPKIAGFSEIFFKSYPLTFENCLVSFLKKKTGEAQHFDCHKEEVLFEQFCFLTSSFKKKIKNLLELERKNGKKICLYGAGHLTAAFINFYKLDNFFEFIVDDSPDKIGLFLPGTNLEIKHSNALMTEQVDICLLGISIEIEEKITSKNKKFSDAGGLFHSIFMSSPISIYAEV